MTARRPEDPPAPGPPGADPQEPRAKDVLADRPVRRVLGERLAARIGSRRWERAPVVCCSHRIFARCEIADPWDPAAEERPLALGPVGVRFEERRQPAPHAQVKQEKKQEKPAWTPPAGVPQAKPRAPTPPPQPATPAVGPKVPAPAPPRRPQRGSPPAAPPPGSARTPAATGKPTSGRFRMQPATTSAPRVRLLAPPPPPEAPTPEAEAPPVVAEPAQDNAPAPVPAQPQTLDDLFGGLGTGGRDRRVGRPSAKPKPS